MAMTERDRVIDFTVIQAFNTVNELWQRALKTPRAWKGPIDKGWIELYRRVEVAIACEHSARRSGFIEKCIFGLEATCPDSSYMRCDYCVDHQ
jgi:hypothetical protein